MGRSFSILVTLLLATPSCVQETTDRSGPSPGGKGDYDGCDTPGESFCLTRYEVAVCSEDGEVVRVGGDCLMAGEMCGWDPEAEQYDCVDPATVCDPFRPAYCASSTKYSQCVDPEKGVAMEVHCNASEMCVEEGGTPGCQPVPEYCDSPGRGFCLNEFEIAFCNDDGEVERVGGDCGIFGQHCDEETLTCVP